MSSAALPGLPFSQSYDHYLYLRPSPKTDAFLPSPAPKGLPWGNRVLFLRTQNMRQLLHLLDCLDSFPWRLRHFSILYDLPL